VILLFQFHDGVSNPTVIDALFLELENVFKIYIKILLDTNFDLDFTYLYLQLKKYPKLSI